MSDAIEAALTAYRETATYPIVPGNHSEAMRAALTAYEAAKAVLGVPAAWDQVSALDGKIPAAGQMALYRRLAYTLRGETFWLARRASRGGHSVEALIKRYGPGAATLTTLLPEKVTTTRLALAALAGSATFC